MSSSLRKFTKKTHFLLQHFLFVLLLKKIIKKTHLLLQHLLHVLLKKIYKKRHIFKYYRFCKSSNKFAMSGVAGCTCVEVQRAGVEGELLLRGVLEEGHPLIHHLGQPSGHGHYLPPTTPHPQCSWWPPAPWLPQASWCAARGPAGDWAATLVWPSIRQQALCALVPKELVTDINLSLRSALKHWGRKFKKTSLIIVFRYFIFIFIFPCLAVPWQHLDEDDLNIALPFIIITDYLFCTDR